MPHIYPDAAKLQAKPKVGKGDCVELVQRHTQVGWTGHWRPWLRVVDAGYIRVGTVIATLTKGGRYLSRPVGNHAAFFMGMGPLDSKTGKPSYIVVMNQWKKKRDISERKIYALGKSKEEGGRYDDSDNAETFWVVE